MRKWVGVVSVRTTLHERDVWAECAVKGRDNFLERPHPRLVVRVRCHWDVYCKALTGSGTDRIGETPRWPGKEVAGRFVNRDGEDLGVACKHGFDAIALVDVEIQVHDPHPMVAGPGDTDSSVVEDPEPTCCRGHGMVVDASRWDECEVGVAVGDLLEGVDNASADIAGN